MAAWCLIVDETPTFVLKFRRIEMMLHCRTQSTTERQDLEIGRILETGATQRGGIVKRQPKITIVLHGATDMYVELSSIA